jgi:hypothetical protein
MPTCRQCQTKFPNWVTINGERKNLQNRKFCLKCSPFGSHNTRSGLKRPIQEVKTCPKCNQEKHFTKFYNKPNKCGKLHSYCKACNHANVLVRQRAFKQKCIDYKGGKCESCGYNSCAGALEFHHKDPTQKDFHISSVRLTSWKKNEQTITKELNKCTMVCANCHREIHESTGTRIRT